MRKKAIAFLCAFAALSAACAKRAVPPQAMELISFGAPAYADSECMLGTPATAANDGSFASQWVSCAEPSPKKPAWVAYDLSAVPAEKRERVLLIWYNNDTSPYDHTLITAVESPGHNLPGAYTVEINSAPGGKLPQSGWVTAVTAGKNTYHSRQHIFQMKGSNWVRLSVIEADGKEGARKAAFNMDVYDASRGTDENFIFYGDSITQMAMHHMPMKGKIPSFPFAEFIRDKFPDRFPAQENGGTGYMKSSDAADNIEKWLAMFPGKYVGLSYGTNDAWSGISEEEFYKNYRKMTEAVISLGKIPMIPTIPWAPGVEEIKRNAPALNRAIRRIYSEFPQVIKGPDFWEIYKNDESMISRDGVHPAWPEGLATYRKEWAETVLREVYGK